MRQTKENKHSNYNSDFYKWANAQAHLLKQGEFEKIDLKHIVEEIEDLGNAQRNALESQMIRLLMHMLKIKYQPKKHTKSWDRSIGNAHIAIERILNKNPSLRKEMLQIWEEAYRYARKKAHIEAGLEIKVFPERCPWSLEEVFQENGKKF